MAFVAAKCTQCGANIEVDDNKDAGICRHCGTAFVTQKVITNHNTYISNNILLDEDFKNELLDNANTQSLRELEKKCERLYELKDFDALEKLSNTIIEKWPLSYIGYKYAIYNYQIVTRYGTPEYAIIVREGAKAGLSIGSYEMSAIPLFRKMTDRMTPEEKAKEKDFIEMLKKIFTESMTQAKLALPKAKTVGMTVFLSFIISVAMFFVLTVLSFFEVVGYWWGIIFASWLVFGVIFLYILGYFPPRAIKIKETDIDEAISNISKL